MISECSTDFDYQRVSASDSAKMTYADHKPPRSAKVPASVTVMISSNTGNAGPGALP